MDTKKLMAISFIVIIIASIIALTILTVVILFKLPATDQGLNNSRIIMNGHIVSKEVIDRGNITIEELERLYPK